MFWSTSFPFPAYTKLTHSTIYMSNHKELYFTTFLWFHTFYLFHTCSVQAKHEHTHIFPEKRAREWTARSFISVPLYFLHRYSYMYRYIYETFRNTAHALKKNCENESNNLYCFAWRAYMTAIIQASDGSELHVIECYRTLVYTYCTFTYNIMYVQRT